jgi:type II secretory pathway component GspD/PulD (secretin)
MQSSIRALAFWSAAMIVSTCFASSLVAQVVQLPTVRFFNVRTAVSVPDAGTRSLGGINRNAYGSVGRGIPAIVDSPYGGRFFRNRSISGNASAARPAVTARIIRTRELEQDVLAAANRQRLMSAVNDPNGSEKTQRRADFMSRHVGRNRKR